MKISFNGLIILAINKIGTSDTLNSLENKETRVLFQLMEAWKKQQFELEIKGFDQQKLHRLCEKIILSKNEDKPESFLGKISRKTCEIFKLRISSSKLVENSKFIGLIEHKVMKKNREISEFEFSIKVKNEINKPATEHFSEFFKGLSGDNENDDRLVITKKITEVKENIKTLQEKMKKVDRNSEDFKLLEAEEQFLSREALKHLENLEKFKANSNIDTSWDKEITAAKKVWNNAMNNASIQSSLEIDLRKRDEEALIILNKQLNIANFKTSSLEN